MRTLVEGATIVAMSAERVPRVDAKLEQRFDVRDLGDTSYLPTWRAMQAFTDARRADTRDALWITEVWDSQASHAASLSLPAVRAAIARGRPLIAGFGEHIVTTPVGGHGI